MDDNLAWPNAESNKQAFVAVVFTTANIHSLDWGTGLCQTDAISARPLNDLEARLTLTKTPGVLGVFLIVHFFSPPFGGGTRRFTVAEHTGSTRTGVERGNQVGLSIIQDR